MTVTSVYADQHAGFAVRRGRGNLGAVHCNDGAAYYPTETAIYFGGMDPGTPYMHQVRVDGLTAGTMYKLQRHARRNTTTMLLPHHPGAELQRSLLVYADSETEPDRPASSSLMHHDGKYCDSTRRRGNRNNLQMMTSRAEIPISSRSRAIVEAGNGTTRLGRVLEAQRRHVQATSPATCRSCPPWEIMRITPATTGAADPTPPRWPMPPPALSHTSRRGQRLGQPAVGPVLPGGLRPDHVHHAGQQQRPAQR